MTTLLTPTITPLHRRPSYAVERWMDWAVVVGLLTVVGFVTGYGIAHYPALNGDEGIYTMQANAVLHGSLAGYTYVYDHPFFGWAQISGLAWIAQALHLGGNLSVINTRFVMLLLAMVNVPLLYGIARRLSFPRLIAAGTVALFALSPLTVDLTRQVYLDNVAMPWVLFAFYLALNPKRNQWIFAASGAAFAVAVLSKETVALFLPALVWVMVQRTVKHLRLMAFAATGAVFTLLVLIYPLFAVLRNELVPGKGHVSLWGDGIMYQLTSRTGSGALWQNGSERQQLWDGWLQYDHILVYAGIVGALLCLFSKRMRPFAAAVGLILVPIFRPGGYLPAMYIVATLPFMALCIGGAFARAWTIIEVRINARRSRWEWAPLLAGIATLTVAGSALALTATVAYAKGDSTQMQTDTVAPYAQTEAWLATHVHKGMQILNDEAFSTDMFRIGLGPWDAVSYYKYDLDPTSLTKVPDGYADFTYIVDTPQMRGDIKALHLSKTQDALDHSHVVASFGDGASRIEIRQVNA